MIHSDIDANRLAAFLAGSLDAREHAEMVEALAASEEGAALLADIVAVHRELEAEGLAPAPALPPEDDAEEEDQDERETEPPRAAAPNAAGSEARVIRLPLAPADAPRDVEPAPPPVAASDDGDDRVTPIGTRRRVPAARWIAWAAVAAGVALVPLLWSRFGGPADDPSRAVAMVEGAALPAGWDEAYPWPRTRGGAADGLTDPARAARLGALLVDLDLAHAARDTAEVARLAAWVGILIEGIPGGSSVASVYRRAEDGAGEPGSAVVGEALEEGWSQLPGLAGEEMVRLGAWAEAGRIAAARRDAAFFRDRGARAVLERASADAALPQRAREGARAALAATEREGAPDWNALSAGLDSLLGTIAG